MPLLFPQTLRRIFANSVERQRLAMALMATFAILALFLAALGIYGVMAYAVSARTREFGIRAALGASRGRILTLVLGQGVTTTMFGLAAGLVLAWLLTRYMASLLIGVTTHDALTFVAAPVLLALVALVACLLPARAATRVQPVEALRVE
jgi:ABC-type antimicrobial peptide transport system permease subunit